MNINQAKAAMARLLGHQAAWRYDENALRDEDKAPIRESLSVLADDAQRAKEAMQAKRAQLLQDPEYLALVAAYNAANKAHGQKLSEPHCYRVTIYRARGIFNEVLVKADNWQDAIDRLREKVRPAARATGAA